MFGIKHLNLSAVGAKSPPVEQTGITWGESAGVVEPQE